MTTNSRILFYLLLALVLTSSLAVCQSDPDEEQHQHQEEQQQDLLPVSQRWGFGFLAGFGVSLIGFLTALGIVFCKNIASDACFEMTIKFLFSLAFGALVGDAMIHILPEAYSSQEADFRVVSAIFIAAIVFFLILERIFEACGITHKHWHNDECHDDHEGAIKHHNHPKKVYDQEPNKDKFQNTIKIQQIKSNNIILEDNESKSHESNNQGQNSHRKNQTPEEEKTCWQNLKGKGSAGYMNLLGSLIHNFMDGLALGVAFATGDRHVFVPVLVAIIAHEIPREMGDVAILMTNSFNATQTILCNGFVNLTSLVGVFIGLAITDLDDVTKNYVLVFVAGNFIFIAADIWRNLFKNSGFFKNFIEFIGFGIGVAAMYLILLIEEGEEGHEH